MLRPFQVNVGRYLNLDRDVSPTARVSELCDAIKASSGEDATSQVLLASDGQQMHPSELIGVYSVGSESKPVFVFYQSHLLSNEPPAAPSLLPARGSLQQQLDLLRRKPTPNLFQKQVALAKRLSEHSGQVSQACSQLTEEYRLQCSGWSTVLNNCSSIIKMYQKHQALFSKSINGFQLSKPHFLKLLQDFPAQVKLLQQLPVPAALQDEDTPTSLYDWISTHDEKNSLQDLGAECQRSLAKVMMGGLHQEPDRYSQVDTETIDATLEVSQQILTTAECFFSQESHINDASARLFTLAEQSASTMETQIGLTQNIQSTSDRALRSGDGGTIADLVLSHHRSLQLMADYLQELEVSVREVETEKVSLTKHIHLKLQQVIELQKRVADNNSQLVLLHEHVKLAVKRFEILEQVCSTPQVLARVLTEVKRRQMYNSLLEKKTGEVGLLLQRAREEEKMLRRSFLNTCGQHFVLTLFPELQGRVPDVTVHLPKSLTKSVVSTEKDLENIRHLLPDDIRDSSTELCSSVKLLASYPPASTSRSNTSGMNSETEIEKHHSDLVASLRMSGFLTGVASQTDSYANTEDTLKEHLGQCSLELESATRELSLTRDQLSFERENSEKIRSETQRKVQELSSTVEQLVKENKMIKLEIDKQHSLYQEAEVNLSLERVERDELLSKVNQTCTVKCERLTSELEQYKMKTEEQANRIMEQNEQLAKLTEQQEATVAEHKFYSEHQKQRIEELLSQLKMSNIELVNVRDSLESRLSRALTKTRQLDEVCARLEDEKKVLKERLEHLSRELEETLSEKESLIAQANQVHDVTLTPQKLEQKEAEVERLKQEMSGLSFKIHEVKESLRLASSNNTLLENELDQLKARCESLESEDHRQGLRRQQAQLTISRLKGQLEAAIAKNNELTLKVNTAEKKAEEKLTEIRNIELSTASRNNSELIADRLQLCEENKKMAEQKAVIAESKLKEMDGKISNYQLEITKLEEVISTEKEERSKTEKKFLEDADLKNKEIEKKSEEKIKLTEKLSHHVEEIKELKERLSGVERERDSHMKQSMEMERALKEVKRSGEAYSNTASNSGTSELMPSVSYTPTKADVVLTASIGSLQVGDTALFLSDPYGNFLALTVDEKTYYLNHRCVAQLESITHKNLMLTLRRKLIMGRLTEKVLVEVRKESNRLHVPVGERLYKVDAEACS